MNNVIDISSENLTEEQRAQALFAAVFDTVVKAPRKARRVNVKAAYAATKTAVTTHGRKAHEKLKAGAHRVKDVITHPTMTSFMADYPRRYYHHLRDDRGVLHELHDLCGAIPTGSPSSSIHVPVLGHVFDHVVPHEPCVIS